MRIFPHPSTLPPAPRRAPFPLPLPPFGFADRRRGEKLCRGVDESPLYRNAGEGI
ncbi:MAG: hypothetical protein ACOYLB_11645 [Phototrophicaceae bacterium]